MTKISGVVITYNEEENIENCLLSLKRVTDEIVVVDSFSKDCTPEICKRHSVRFYQNYYQGQIEQKNYALDKAKYPWILSLDGDEALSEELIEEIVILRKNFTMDGYIMKRLSRYCGKWIRHGGWYPDPKLRLWHRERSIWAGYNPHDRVIPNNPNRIGHLGGHILHYTFNSLEEHQNAISNYSEIGANSLLKNSPSFVLIRLFLSPFTKFVRDYLFRLGFLDGKQGWDIVRLSMKSKFLKYRRLRQLIQGSHQ